MTAPALAYDPDTRRDTLLAAHLKAVIRERGPLPVKRYMESCLTHSEHGYYRTRTAIGAAGDFITAPEISQVFGELIGLWAAVVWETMGRPQQVTLLEIGPGRGTMMADALRAADRLPGFSRAARVVLAEVNEALKPVQTETLARFSDIVRHAKPGEPMPDGPLIVLANELLDCVPVGQIVKAQAPDGASEWRQRVVVLDAAGSLQFGIGEPVHVRPQAHAPFLDDAPPGSIVEDRNHRGLASEIARVAHGAPVAALFIDYGHAQSGIGDTLQAVRRHMAEHPLTSPGEADLTAQVDFQAFAATLREEAAKAASAIEVDGPVTQAEFLGSLGILERASRLMHANPQRAGEIEAGIARLIGVPGMGDRFKVIGVRSAGLPPLPGFPLPPAPNRP